MQFRTPVSIPPASFHLTPANPILAAGSCFAQVMGEKLLHHKFNTLVNPFGVLFNPVSLAILLENALLQKELPPEKAVQSGNRWFHYDLHSQFSASSPEELLKKGNAALQQTSLFLAQADCLLLTLGTAFVYRLRESNQLVANCHKVPAARFTKELLSLEEITESISGVLTRLLALRPLLQVILTVSPVRHLKDTLPLNSVSKSLLRVACHQLEVRFPQVHYFPSYELMTDDLRDYRFYKADMIHPSEVAEDYIWTLFSETYFNENTREVLKKWEKVRKALLHKPFHEDSPEFIAFAKSTLAKLKDLHPQLPVADEIRKLEEFLHSSHS